MTKVLVIQGAAMNMRGKVQVEVFGTSTLDDINKEIHGYGQELGIDIDIFHSNIEGEVVNYLYSAHDAGDVDACLINPAGYTTSSGVLRAAIAQVSFPVIEVHASNPTSRGTVSTIQPVSKGSVYGFGYYGYYLALEGVKHLIS
jgi:3-dehydroquinate dehydratase-2